MVTPPTSPIKVVNKKTNQLIVIDPLDIRKYVSENNKIQLIKLLREISDMGLKDAKELIEARLKFNFDFQQNSKMNYTLYDIEDNINTMWDIIEQYSTIYDSGFEELKKKLIAAFDDYVKVGLNSPVSLIEAHLREFKYKN
jgi:hypothetical protein